MFFILLVTIFQISVQAAATLRISSSSPKAAPPVLDSFVSYSIEFSSFPDFAGNKTHPNIFSDNLLENLGEILGTRPIIRVGGNTQDYALYDPDLPTAIKGTYTKAAQDYPTVISIGKSYFESYSTWPNTKFIHGFNLGKNGTAGYDTLVATVPLACEALGGGKLEYWELGNEPDLYKTSAQGIVRPSSWTEQAYVNEWLRKTRIIRALVSRNCPDEPYAYMAPSFAGTRNSLDPVLPWSLGLDSDKNIAQISTHNYMGGAEEPGVTLQNRLMNHSSVVDIVSSQLNVSRLLSKYSLPFVMGETNSLYNQGRPGLSDTFGAALWGVDFNLWCASQGIRRVHMHQGTNYRYASWQPVDTGRASKGTKAPYYGNIAVANVLGRTLNHTTVIRNIPLSSELNSAYATYQDGRLVRIAIINLREYNYTTNKHPRLRPSTEYQFHIDGLRKNFVIVRRLIANGSDSITGITWNGRSYNYELAQGKPVRLPNTTVGEYVSVADRNVTVLVPWSSAAVIYL